MPQELQAIGGGCVPPPGNFHNRAAYVYDFGHVDSGGLIVDGSFGVRPAFQLNLSSVLFTSASGVSKSDTFAATTDGSGINTWKLTLKGSDTDMAPSTSGTTNPQIGYTGYTLPVTHRAAGVSLSDVSQVSAMLTDSDGTVLYYGKVNGDVSATSTGITIPAGLLAGNYKLYVFAEDVNNGNLTDYASVLGTPIAIMVGNPSPTPSDGGNNSDNGDSNGGQSSSGSSSTQTAYVNPLSWNYVKDNPNSLCLITKQGALCQEVFRSATPADYTEVFSFNLMLKGADQLIKTTYDAKSGEFVLYIPSEYQKAGRTFTLIGADKDGKPVIFTDSDTSDTSITIADLKGFTGYAFSLIYTDKAGTAATTESGVYTVVKGDTLSGIAEKLGKTRKYLLSKNDLEDANRLHIGQKINY